MLISGSCCSVLFRRLSSSPQKLATTTITPHLSIYVIKKSNTTSASQANVSHGSIDDTNGGYHENKGIAPSPTTLFQILTRRPQITETLNPTALEIHNDSHLHAHHKAMQGSTSAETHFRVYITSDAFEKKRQLQRHKMIYSLMADEMAKEGGIHALQLQTRTPEEAEKFKAQKTADTDKGIPV